MVGDRDGTRGELDRVELAPRFGWLFRSRVRALAVHEGGLMVERGTGQTFVAWSQITSVICATAQVVARTGRVSVVDGGVEIHCKDMARIDLPSSTRLLGQEVVALVVERANLVWFRPEAHGRKLPPMALKADVAENLRAAQATE